MTRAPDLVGDDGTDHSRGSHVEDIEEHRPHRERRDGVGGASSCGPGPRCARVRAISTLARLRLGIFRSAGCGYRLLLEPLPHVPLIRARPLGEFLGGQGPSSRAA
jgi:hypothetical protein